eukprot:TRINITY_DN12687_c0_g1_i2.p1 TRINITY_DN12687_c0_g1~~TRINITY_DN12687_c0_g1_i2.p1  ORF type:complete len:187 (-),score=18.29 TRINITY_DN12687_c0_g1_i2:355-915(-)
MEDTDDYSVIQVPRPRLSRPGCMDGCFPHPPLPTNACTICASQWRFWRRKYECAMCLLSVCSSCAGHEQSIAGEKRRVCDMCVMAKAHRKSEDAQPQPEGSQAPVREPTFAFEILEQGLPQKQRPSGMIPTHMLLELLGDGAPLPNQLEDLLALADENGDGFVDYKQFVAMMAARGSDVFGAEGEV